MAVTRASKIITVVVVGTGQSLDISCDKIISIQTDGSTGSFLTFLNDRDTVITQNVTSSPATIHTASASNTLYVTQMIVVNGVDTYIHIDRVIEAFTEGSNIVVIYDAEKSAPQKFTASLPVIADFATDNQNVLPLTVQGGSAVIYVNNLLISKVVTDVVDTDPSITFTTKVRTNSGVVSAAGTGYTSPTLSVTGGGGNGIAGTLTTKVVSATVAAGGSGGSNGTQTVTGTTGTGTKFQASVTVAGGAITAVLSITVAGNYTVPVTLITAEPVTGASLVGSTLSVSLGVLDVNFSAAGTGYTSYPTFTVVDATGINAIVTSGFVIESPLTIVDGGSDINTAPTLTFSAGTTLATATAAVSGGSVVSTTLTGAGLYVKGTNAYPTLTVSTTAGSWVYYDKKTTGNIKIQVAETKAAIKSAINAL
jgi:hypothetical protein